MAARVLIVTWQAGGGVHPALGLGRLLAERGHEVSMLAPRILETQVEATGCAWRAFPAAAEFDPAQGRAADAQRPYVEETFFGSAIPAALRAAANDVRPDAVVVDALLASTVSTAQSLGPPAAALVHTLRRFHGNFEIFGSWGRDQVNALRKGSGQDHLPENRETVFVELQRRSELELVAIPAVFDARDEAEPNTVHAGWFFEKAAADDRLEFPWAAEDPTPLVVVGLSSTYMNQENLLQRIFEALAELPVHVLASTGPDLEPAELEVPEGIELRRYVPHALAVPRAALMVTHAGMGTLMTAFTHGVPCVCIPLGRDQPTNAARAAELGAAIALPPEATAVAIRTAVVEALESQALRAQVGRLRDAIHAVDGATGARAVEQLATRGRAERSF